MQAPMPLAPAVTSTRSSGEVEGIQYSGMRVLRDLRAATHGAASSARQVSLPAPPPYVSGAHFPLHPMSSALVQAAARVC